MVERTGFNKWKSCKFSLNFSLYANDEMGYAMAEEGYNENYGCEEPNVVESGKHSINLLYEEGNLTNVAVLHGLGKFDDLKVHRALNKSCANCPFHQTSTDILKI